MRMRTFQKNPALFFLFLFLSFLTIFAQAQQPPACTPPPAGMVAWWRADGSATDVVGGHDGTLMGGVTFTPIPCATSVTKGGMVGQAFSFDGTSGYVLIPNNAALHPPDAITIDAWVYPTSFHDGLVIISKYNTYLPCCNNVSWWLGVGESGQVEWFVVDPEWKYQSALTDARLSLNAWSHVTATFDTATQVMAVYINGQRVHTSCVPGDVCSPVTSIMQSTADVMIGAATYNSLPFPGLGSFWKGRIDEVEVFNRALSLAEIQAIFNARSAGKCRTATFSSTLTDINNARQLGWIDNTDLANSLLQKIHAAQAATLTDRHNILSAFKDEVTAQAGQHITGAAVQTLSQDADTLLSQN